MWSNCRFLIFMWFLWYYLRLHSRRVVTSTKPFSLWSSFKMNFILCNDASKDYNVKHIIVSWPFLNIPDLICCASPLLNLPYLTILEYSIPHLSWIYPTLPFLVYHFLFGSSFLVCFTISFMELTGPYLVCFTYRNAIVICNCNMQLLYVIGIFSMVWFKDITWCVRLVQRCCCTAVLFISYGKAFDA